jgi:helix-turn-helix protein
MGLLVTAEEAGQLVDRHERIVRGHIKRGDLPATKEGNRWRVDTDDLEKVPGWKVDRGRLAELQMHDSRSSEQLLTRLQVLESELRSINNRLHLLEARDRPATDALRGDSGSLGRLDVESLSSYPRRSPEPGYAAPYVPVGVPAGARRMIEVTRLHGISHATAKRSIEAGVVAGFTRPQPNRPGYVEYWFLPEQIGPALRVWQSRGIEMHTCPDCPHDQR